MVAINLTIFMSQVFEPWLKNAEARKQEGLKKPVSLVEACEILGDSKNLQDNAEAKLKVLEDAAASSQKMTSHNEADQKVCAFRERWTVVHECFKEWVARMVSDFSTRLTSFCFCQTTLVECWNKLDGNVGELSSWVATKVIMVVSIIVTVTVIIIIGIVITQDSSAPEGGSEISIEKLETQLNTLKTMFAEKQKLVSDLEAYGPEGCLAIQYMSQGISIIKGSRNILTKFCL